MDNNDVVRVPFLPLKLGSLGLADVIRKYTSNQESIGDYPSPGLLVNYIDRMVWLILGGLSKVSREEAGIALNNISKEENTKIWQQVADAFKGTAELFDEAKKDSALISSIHMLESLDKIQVMDMREHFKEIFIDFSMWIEAELDAQESSARDELADQQSNVQSSIGFTTKGFKMGKL